MSTFIDIHVLQQVPPSNLNRDDTGSPKTAVYGGALRARVSSQAWKRATRMSFKDDLDRTDLGYRTTRVVELVAERIAEINGDVQDPGARATAVLKAAGLELKAPRAKKGEDEPGAARSGYLVFLSAPQVDALAQLAVDAGDDSIDKKAAKAAFQEHNGLNVGLFGRMVADDANLNVDAAVQVAHAISTHAIETDFDYFTAVDDRNPSDETGAGMIGTVEFLSATLYRYATIAVDGLRENLGDAEASTRAVEAFVRGFVRSMPTGKQNTFANRTLPALVMLCVRDDQPLNLVGAFESPVTASAGSITEASVAALSQHADEMYAAFDCRPARTLVCGTQSALDQLSLDGDTVTFDELVSAAAAAAGDSIR